MNRYIKIEEKGLIDLIDTAYKYGFKQALFVLQSLEETAGMTDEDKKKFLEMLTLTKDK